MYTYRRPWRWLSARASSSHSASPHLGASKQLQDKKGSCLTSSNAVFPYPLASQLLHPLRYSPIRVGLRQMQIPTGTRSSWLQGGCWHESEIPPWHSALSLVGLSGSGVVWNGAGEQKMVSAAAQTGECAAYTPCTSNSLTLIKTTPRHAVGETPPLLCCIACLPLGREDWSNPSTFWAHKKSTGKA